MAKLTRCRASRLIATSRKRKLRELYAVADCDGPIPLNWVIDVDHPPPPAPSPVEVLFLENNDITKSVPDKILNTNFASSTLALLISFE